MTESTRVSRAPRTILPILLFSLCIISAGCRVTGTEEIARFPEERALPEEITILVWNVQKGGSSRMPADLRSLIESEQADLAFLQEAKTDKAQTEHLGGVFAGSWSYPWPYGSVVGVATLSRVPPVWTKKLTTKWREFYVTAPKASLVAEYPLPDGRSLLAINVHCINFQRWATFQMRSQLADLKAIMAQHEGPIIFAGDFNTRNAKRLNLVNAFARELELREVEENSLARTTADQGTGFLNWLFGVDAAMPLDRVYYRGFSQVSVAVLGYDSSDHKPIVVKLRLEKNVAGESRGEPDHSVAVDSPST